MLVSGWKILVCEADTGELPARFRREKVAIGSADVGGGGDARAAAQNELAAHEFAVVLAQGAGQGMEAGVSEIGAGGPFPAVAEELGRTFKGRAAAVEYGGRAVRLRRFC